jgi:hypothetical protein
VSRQVGLPRDSRARRPKPKGPPSIFGGLLKAAVVSPWWSHQFSNSYLESTVPAAACEVAISVESAGRACSTRRVRSLRLRSASLRYFLRTATVMGRKQTTRDELNARTKANGYKRGAHQEEDSRRDCNKHKDDIIKRLR